MTKYLSFGQMVALIDSIFFIYLLSVIDGVGFSNIKDIFEILSWLVGGSAVLYGLHVWKKQMKGTTEYEVARKIMHSAYRIRDGVQIIRNPMMWAQEQEYTGDRTGLSDEQIRMKGRMNAYNKRFTTLTEVREKLLVDIIEAEVLWGVKIRELIYDLFMHLRQLEIAVEDDFRFQTLTDYQRRTDSHYQVRSRQIPEILYSMQGGMMMVEPHADDKYANELKKKIDSIGEYLRGYIDFD